MESTYSNLAIASLSHYLFRMMCDPPADLGTHGLAISHSYFPVCSTSKLLSIVSTPRWRMLWVNLSIGVGMATSAKKPRSCRDHQACA